MDTPDITAIPGYSIREMEHEEFFPLFLKHRTEVFGGSFEFDTRAAMSDQERERSAALGARLGNPFRLQYAVYHGSTFVGWSFGWQDTAERFYMTNSAVLPAHRGKGIYSALVRKVIDRAGREGFQVIHSRHTATNNAVLIPKLKAGFVISGLEISPQFGTLVHLSYFFSATRRAMMDVRSGQTRLDDTLRTLMP